MKLLPAVSIMQAMGMGHGMRWELEMLLVCGGR